MNETRSYMTARLNHAGWMFAMGNLDYAIDEYKALLELNPNDNQGVRYCLVNALVSSKRYVEFINLFKKYDEDSANWLFNYALALFSTIYISAIYFTSICPNFSYYSFQLLYMFFYLFFLNFTSTKRFRNNVSLGFN